MCTAVCIGTGKDDCRRLQRSRFLDDDAKRAVVSWTRRPRKRSAMNGVVSENQFNTIKISNWWRKQTKTETPHALLQTFNSEETVNKVAKLIKYIWKNLNACDKSFITSSLAPSGEGFIEGTLVGRVWVIL
jgi:hypothetical protein